MRPEWEECASFHRIKQGVGRSHGAPAPAHKEGAKEQRVGAGGWDGSGVWWPPMVDRRPRFSCRARPYSMLTVQVSLDGSAWAAHKAQDSANTNTRTRMMVREVHPHGSLLGRGDG